MKNFNFGRWNFQFFLLSDFCFVSNIESSYISISGIAKSICEITSGGVKIAAIMNIKTIAYFLDFIKACLFIILNFISNIKKIGSKKQSPNALSSVIVKSIYSVIFACNISGVALFPLAKEIKKLNVCGRTKK